MVSLRLAALGGEDRVLHLRRAFVTGVRFVVAACAGQHHAAVAVDPVDFRGHHAEIALALVDHPHQRVAVENALVVVAPDSVPEVAQFVDVGLVAHEVLAFGVEHALPEFGEIPFDQIVASDVDRTADQLSVGVYVAVVAVEVGTALQAVFQGVVGVDQGDEIRGQPHLAGVIAGLVVGAR